jgi:hypothetical protein
MRIVSLADSGTRKDMVDIFSPYIDFRPAPDRLPPRFSVFMRAKVFICLCFAN